MTNNQPVDVGVSNGGWHTCQPGPSKMRYGPPR